MSSGTISKVWSNIKTISEKGGNDADIESYIREEGLNPSDFEDSGVFAPGLKPNQYEEILKAKEFESTKVGKLLIGTDKVLGFLPRALGIEDEFKPISSIMKDEFSRNNELETLPPIQRAIAMTKDVGQDVTRKTANFAQLLGPAGKLASSAWTAGSVGVSSLASGNEPLDAAKDAAKAAATNLAFMTALPLAGKLIKSFGVAALKADSPVKNWAIDEAIQNPKIIEETMTPFEASNAVAEAAKKFSSKVRGEYGDALSKFDQSVPVAVDKIEDMVKKLDFNPSEFYSMLKAAAKSQAINISDDALKLITSFKGDSKKSASRAAKDLLAAELSGDQLLAIKDSISFGDARKINSLLHDVLDTSYVSGLGSGTASRIGNIKTALLNSMENSQPGIRDLNRQYADDVKAYKTVVKSFSESGGEARVMQIAQEASGVRKNKTDLMNALRKVQDKVGDELEFRVIDKIKNSAIAEQFRKAEFDKFASYTRLGAGALLGGQVGGIPGAIAGSIAQMVTQSPKFASGAVNTISAATKAAQSRLGQELTKVVSGQLAKPTNSLNQILWGSRQTQNR